MVPLFPALLVGFSILYCGMLCTAFMFQVRPESTFTNCCRLSVHCLRTIYLILWNLYHCRLGDIPPVICATDDDNNDELQDEEIQRMKPRPGIETALTIEHRKAVTRILESEWDAAVKKTPTPKQSPSSILKANIYG
jgi:hypothetical protein